MDLKENQFSIEFFENNEQSKWIYLKKKHIFDIFYKIFMIIFLGVILFYFIKVSNFILSNELSTNKSILLGIILVGLILFFILLSIIFGALKLFSASLKKENTSLEIKLES